jgi:YegS/Rv2252/BmrU family lipid kinase
MNPENGYILYIINPKSGPCSHRAISRRFKKYLLDKGFDVRREYTKSLEHACELAEKAAVDHDCQLVVAAGGDGTVREVAHGLEGSDRKFLLVPCGTENLLSNELGFDEKLETTIKAFEDDFIRPLDLGTMEGKCFTSIAGVGFDGEVVHKVMNGRKGHINHFAYFEPIWRTFWNYDFPPVAVDVDGERIFEGKGMVFVGNTSRYAIGLNILKDADYSDGLLDICIYKCSGKIHLAKHSLMTVLKQHTTFNDVMYLQGRDIKITALDSRLVRTEIDGDPGPDLPVDIKILPDAINCIVPKGAKPAGMRTRLKRVIG